VVVQGSKLFVPEAKHSLTITNQDQALNRSIISNRRTCSRFHWSFVVLDCGQQRLRFQLGQYVRRWSLWILKRRMDRLAEGVGRVRKSLEEKLPHGNARLIPTSWCYTRPTWGTLANFQRHTVLGRTFIFQTGSANLSFSPIRRGSSLCDWQSGHVC
jgi:hypothetical protein